MGMSIMQTVGCDLGDRRSELCILDAEGTVLERDRIATTVEGFRRRFEVLPRGRVVLEVGTHSPWVSALLDELGHEVIVANPRRVKLISDSDDKSDRCDAERLARLGRADPKLLAPIRHRGPEARRDLALLKTRDLLVRQRRSLVNRVRGTIKVWGLRLPKCTTESFAKRAQAHIPEALQDSMTPLLRCIDKLSEEIKALDRHIEKEMPARHPEIARLTQVYGVGPLVGAAFVLTIEDPKRFRRSRQLGAYLGLRPKRAQSGRSDPQLRIAKSGDVFLRRLLVTSAHVILGPRGPDSDLRRWGLARLRIGGKAAKKRAVVGVARKLAVLLHHLWTTGDTYQPMLATRAA